MDTPPPFPPTPQIPAGMAPEKWYEAITYLARDGSDIVVDLLSGGTGIPGPGSGFGAASKYGSYVALLQSLYGLTTDAATATAYLMSEDVVPLLSRALEANQRQARTMSTDAADNLSEWLTDAGYPEVADVGSFTAALARGEAAMLSDWAALTAETQQGVARSVANGLGLGLHPDEVAGQVHKALLQTGQASYARGLLIARTEMADMQATSFGALLRGSGVMPGWWWRARADACPVCQIQHGRVFADEHPMNQHHMCRCVMVPVVEGTKEATIKPGNYIGAEKRSREDCLDPPAPTKRGAKQQRGIPESWRDDLPDDLRKIVGQRENENWRPSWGLVKPGTEPWRPDKPKPKITPPPKVIVPEPPGSFGSVPDGLTGVRKDLFKKDPTTYEQGRGFAWDGADVEDFRVGVNRTADGHVLQFKATDRLHSRIMADAPPAPTRPASRYRRVPKSQQQPETLADYAKVVAKEKYGGTTAWQEVEYAANHFPDYDPAFHAKNLKGIHDTPEMKAQMEDIARESHRRMEAAKKPKVPEAPEAPAREPKWKQAEGTWGTMVARIPKKGTRWEDCDPLTDGKGMTLTRDLGDGVEVRYVTSLDRMGQEVQMTYRNTVQVFVPDGVDPEDVLRRLDTELGITARYPSEDSLRKAAEGKLISSLDWQEAKRARDGTSTPESWAAALDGIKSKYGVTAGDVRWEADWWGQPVPRVPQHVTDALKAAGNVGEFQHSLSDVSWVGRALSDPAEPPLVLMSTHRRFSDGVGGGGMSSGTDTYTGGAEYVFLRPQNPYPGESFRGAVFSPDDVLGRADWYAYSSDQFGVLNSGHSMWHGDRASVKTGSDALGSRGGTQETMVKGRLEVPPGGMRLRDQDVADLIKGAIDRGEWNDTTAARFEKYVRDPFGKKHDWDYLVKAAGLFLPPR